MPQQLRRGLDALLTGTWFIPSVIACGAFVLCYVGLGLDAAAADATNGWLRFVYVSDSVEARSLMATMLASMMTMVSLVFSITMLVLTLASRQFGPRLVREFMSSVMTQVVLGTYVMTILYCLLMLASTGAQPRTGDVAHPSVSIGIGLTFVDSALLIFFLHSLGRSLMSESIIARIGAELDTTLDRLKPQGDAAESDEPSGASPAKPDPQACRFGAVQSGYVQAIEWSLAGRTAARAGVRIVLNFRPGDYLVKGGREIAVSPAEKCNAELRREIGRFIVLGIDRTPLQDPMFSIRHLVEVALRALSPGVNDPFTATAVLDRLASSMSRLMGLALPSGVWRDATGQVRVICQEATHATVMGAAFDAIRQNGGDKPLVMIHLVDALARIATHAQQREHLQLVAEKLDAVEKEVLLRLVHPYDLDSVKARLESARQQVSARRAELARSLHDGRAGDACTG